MLFVFNMTMTMTMTMTMAGYLDMTHSTGLKWVALAWHRGEEDRGEVCKSPGTIISSSSLLPCHRNGRNHAYDHLSPFT